MTPINNTSSTSPSPVNWNLDNWKNFQIKHVPAYPDQRKLDKVLEKIRKFPPLVFAGEVTNLRRMLIKAEKGEAFLLQGGDCAESFDQISANSIRDTFKVLLQMSVVLTAGTHQPIIKMGRIAGQFAKPRSSDEETNDGVTLPSYFGDIINDHPFTEAARVPDPVRMLEAYSISASTLNLLRAFSTGGFADLHQVHAWNMDFVNAGKEMERYQDLANTIEENLKFMAAMGISSSNTRMLREIDFYTSHEMLLIPYEAAMTRVDSTFNQTFNTSAHFLWIGDRTRFLESAHVEYCRGIQNPIGIKCGPKTDREELIKIIELLNPENESGKIVLIARFGANQVNDFLPKLIQSVQSNGKNVVWSCDPMHGNVVQSSTGHKTRNFDAILQEVKQFIEIHKSEKSIPGGIHLEMTGNNVTECTGGMEQISDENLREEYQTLCDPRLNANQSIELSFLISDLLNDR